MKEVNRPAIVSTGVISLITVFAVLLLVSFSVLVLSSARADGKLTEKAALAVTEYYAADARAEQNLLQIGRVREQTAGDRAAFRKEMEAAGFTVREQAGYEGTVVCFQVPAGARRILYAEIGIPADEKDALARLCWQTLPGDGV